nr:MAG TPA: hypothetical protein [Caudoviricetes sp.]
MTLAADIDNFIGICFTSFSVFLSSLNNSYLTRSKYFSQAYF